MATKKQHYLAVRVTDGEQVWGFVYLLISLFVLPALLQWLNGFLPVPLGSIWINLIYFVLNFCFILWIFRGFYKRCLSQISRDVPSFLLAVTIGFAVYWLSNFGLAQLVKHVFPGYTNLNDGAIAGMAHSNFLVSFIGTVFLVPIAEESLHRGLVFGTLYPKNHAIAYILSTAVFAAVHIMGYVGTYEPLHLALAFVQYIPAGLILAWAYRKSGSIFAPVLIHMVINAAGMFSLR